MIKVTGGFLRGRYITSIDGETTRPTSSKVREAIFNIISDKIENTLFLDLFSGTGLVGIEALSRGSSKSFFVERDIKAYKILKKNLNDLDLNNSCETYKTNAEIFLKKTEEHFNIIYIDPPYKSNSYNEVFKILSEKKELISEEGIIIVEHATKIPLPEINLNLNKFYKYGDTTITIFSK